MKKPDDSKEQLKNELAYQRAVCKDRKKYFAWLAARDWVWHLKKKRRPQLSLEEKKALIQRLSNELGVQVFNAVKSGDANYFRYLADFIESGATRFSEARFWLADKHIQRDERGRLKRYTHDQLLNSAQTDGINIDERQLRRLMSEAGFKFKNSRRNQ